MRRLLLGVLGVALLAAAGFVVNLVWFRPLSINHFFDREFIRFGLIEPELMSQFGLLDGTPFDFYNDELTGASMAQVERGARITRNALATLDGYEHDRLDPPEQLSYDIFRWFLETNAAGDQFRYHPYAITQLNGAYLELVDFMSRVHRVADSNGADDYLIRLRAVANKLDQQLEVARQQESMGIVPPRFIVEKALENLANIRDVPARESLYLTPFTEKLAGLELPASRIEDYTLRTFTIVRDAVNPAYDRTRAYLQDLAQRASDDAGVWKLPDAAEYYAFCIRLHTGTGMSAEEIHALGLSEVARIEAEMRASLAALGYEASAPADALRTIAADPRFLRPDTDATREAMVAEYQAIVDEISTGIGSAFGRTPKAALEVRRIPAYRESTAATHYSPATADGSRPGVFFVNLAEIPPTWSMRTLAYHEGVPGHHFQIGLQQEQKGVPLFRLFLPFTAFVEGWALYAERLAWELGYEEDPYDNLGRLKAELFRAVRLVVDTGIHHERWSREQAIAYFRDHLGEEQVAEVERYVVAPGQALAYKVGMLRILAERERARQALGDRFDLRDFHDVVIGNGALPLDILAQQVDRYIAERS